MWKNCLSNPTWNESSWTWHLKNYEKGCYFPLSFSDIPNRSASISRIIFKQEVKKKGKVKKHVYLIHCCHNTHHSLWWAICLLKSMLSCRKMNRVDTGLLNTHVSHSPMQNKNHILWKTYRRKWCGSSFSLFSISTTLTICHTPGLGECLLIELMDWILMLWERGWGWGWKTRRKESPEKEKRPSKIRLHHLG